MNTLKFKRVRAGYYETGNEIEGAYVIYSNGPRSWSVCQYQMNRWFPYEYLDLVTIETAGTFADAKHLANFDAQISNRDSVEDEPKEQEEVQLMNTTQEQKFCAVTYDSDMTPIGYWLGTFPACERFGKRERDQDERVSMFIINEVDPNTSWEQKRDELWPADPNAKGRVIWSGTWKDLK